MHIPEDAITMLGKRGDELNELWAKLFGPSNVHFARLESSSATHPSESSSSSSPSAPADGWTDLSQPLPSIPEEPSPVSSPDHAPPSPGLLTESGYELMNWEVPPGGPGPSGPASSTMSSTTDHGLLGAHALLKPGPSTYSDREMVDVSPQPGSASPTEIDHMMVDVPPPLGSASTLESDHEMVDAPPLPGSALPIASDHEMVDVPPSSSVSSKNPNRLSMGAGFLSGKRKKFKVAHVDLISKLRLI